MKVKIEVTDQQIADTLCSGLEGGVGYWSQIQDDKYVKPKKLKFRFDKERVYEHIDYPMNEGGVLLLKDTGTGKHYKLTLSKLRKAVQALANSKDYKHHFSSILEDNTDQITGDVLIQMAVLGDVIYG